jgi:S-(hydroxymethyl)glutathione dehydrogenase/alcohol dehydrogenase
MRAALLRSIGDDKLEVRDDIELGPVGPGQVRIAIGATGICHSDLSAMNGTIPQPVPAILGHEGAGVVAEVGEGVTNVQPGDHVIVAWSPACGHCRNCVDRSSPQLCGELMGEMFMGNHFRLDGQPFGGMAGAGTFAEQLIVPSQAAIKIDADIPLDIASLVGCGVMTGVGAALNTARVKPGSSVVVFGCGGVGISAIQGARVAGASEIVAVDLVESKLETAQHFGATHAVTPDQLDSVKGLLTGDGFDYAFEAIGNPVTMRAAYDATRRGGTTCIVGVGKMDQTISFSAFELFYSEKTLVGSYYGSADVRSDFHRILRLWQAGRLDLESMISRRMTIDEVNDGLVALAKGEVVRQVITF